MNNNKDKIITYILVGIIIAIIGVVAYLGYVALQDKKTEDRYTDAATEFEEAVASSRRVQTQNVTVNAVDISNSGDGKKLEGYNIIGTIEIPKVELKSVILDEVTPKSISIAIGLMYTTGGLNEPGTTVLYGHNYRNKLFFSRNDELSNGDYIYILDSTGRKITYRIYDTFITTSTDTSFYANDAEKTEGKRELVLSTCTDDVDVTDNRFIVLAREVEE